jgi:WD40 repeat protein
MIVVLDRHHRNCCQSFTCATAKHLIHPLCSVLWCPLSTKQNVLVSLDEETIRVWNLDEGKKVVEARSEAKAGDLQHIAGGCWDPHDSNAVAVASGTLVEIWDLRTMRSETHIVFPYAW